jgi:RES domain-containing protein
MIVFRIVQDKSRTKDLSGTGAFRRGGRWNSKGVYMLYTSENSSLAFLEYIIPFDQDIMPPQLYIMEIGIKNDKLIYQPSEDEYSKDWKLLSSLANQVLGDLWMREKKWLGIRVRSAINPTEYNVLLNPLYPKFHDGVEIKTVRLLPVDDRVIKDKNKY